MKVAIVGSRDLSPEIEPHLPEGTTAIVTGGAKGVDRAAMDLAERLGLQLIVFWPDYKRYGRGAPIVRNKQIIEEADSVLAFWDGKSRGTKSSIDLAKKAGKPFHVVKNTPEEEADVKRVVKLAKNLPDPDTLTLSEMSWDEKMDLMLAEALAETWKAKSESEAT